ncbi:oligosaccharide flippase family protein [Paracraurococcus ruber]|nr:oligosaccharide flippase family protein [Paracraurococcus ruber]
MAGLVLRGAILMVLLRFAIRAIGLVSVLITARLLTPADFGVIGTASIVIGFFALLQSIGLGDALVRLRRMDAGHVHTAWTLNLLVGLLVTVGIFLSAPLAARWLGEPALTGVLHWMAFTPTLNALVSPGTTTFLRDFAFRKEFRLKVFQKVVVVVATVLGAWLTGNYWGLVWGGMAGTVVYVVASYVSYPYWPRLALSRLPDLLGFSFWTLVQSIATYVAVVADEVIVRRLMPTELFGLYHTSRDLSRTMVAELVAPAASALLPGLARLQEEPARFARAAKEAVGAGVIVAVAAGLGVSATATEITGLLLGAKWTGAAPFLAFTAIGVAGQTVAGLHRSILAALDKQHWSAMLWGLRGTVLVVGCGTAGMMGDALLVAETYATLSVLLTLLDYGIIFTALKRPGVLPAIFLRPAIAGLAMLGALMLLPADLPLLLSAPLKVALGALVYGLVLLGAWWAMGRPEGAETALLHRLPPRLATPLLRRRRPA